MKQDNRIPDQNNEIVATFLNLLLADEYVLYTKTRTAHWNMDGENYFELHVFLENQCNVLSDMMDDIAEQIRSLGHFAIGSLKDFISIANMNDDNHNFKNSKQIFDTLLEDHETIIQVIRHEVQPLSNQIIDLVTVEFLIGIMEHHEKMTQMIRSFLSEPDFIQPMTVRNFEILFADRNN